MASVLFVIVAGLAGASAIHVDPGAPFPRELSAFNFFADASTQTPNDDLIPYDVITPLFSDYSEKYRFVYVPAGKALTYREDGSFEFPVGAALVKTFAYPGETLDLVETRVMIRRKSGWDGAAYVWNDAQTEARLSIAGKRVPVSWVDDEGQTRGTNYFVPNMNQCKQCHRPQEVFRPLGFETRHINRDVTIGGTTVNQFDRFVEAGLITGAPQSASAARTTSWTDSSATLDARVRAYLDINCGHCHNASGLASHTQLDLTHRQENPQYRGVLKRPTSAGRASMDRYFAIKPGDPDQSFLLQRLMSTEPAVRMPQIMRSVVHEEGVALIREWILSLEEPAQ
jgi:uncharacterized repeat protein (TIGR03806 family)